MSFRLIRQRDSMQCGVAALAMICDAYGVKYSIPFLEKFCHPTSDGVSMKGIHDAASELGLQSVALKVKPEQLSDYPLPAILHWNHNHFVVLYKITKKRYHIADPAKGKITYKHEDFVSHWTGGRCDDSDGLIMLLEPTHDFGEIREPYSEKHSYEVIRQHLRRHWKTFLVVVVTMAAACGFQLLFPFLTREIVDTGIHNHDIGFIWLIMIGELMIVVGQATAGFIRRWLLLKLSMKINISLVKDFFLKLHGLRMGFFDTKLMGDLLQRIGDHSRVQNFLTGQLLSMTFSILSLIVFTIVLLTYDWLIFIVFLTGSVIYGLWISFFLRRRETIDYELFEKQSQNQQTVYRFVSSMQEIKLQGCESRRRDEWEEVQNSLFDVQLRSLKLQQTQEAGSVVINEIKNIVITVLAATAVITEEISLGTMLAVQYIIGQLNSPVDQLMSFIYATQDVVISLDRINEIHTSEDEENPDGIRNFKAPTSIAINHIYFKYDPHAIDNILSDVSFHIPDGKITAIVGASGSGKTTLIKLMLGYYPVESGSISIAGKNIEEYSYKWLRERCGVVMQDGVIFSESMRRNIAVGDGEVNEERLVEAAKIANIHDFIESLPLAYGTKIGPDGTGLSQGQKQRILLARAVYKNPDFIFLDEATNALDAANERAIVENLNEFYKGRTAVVVAHRLSTVRNADQIIVLDKGRVVEIGSHESLIARRGIYYNLVKNQLELGN